MAGSASQPRISPPILPSTPTATSDSASLKVEKFWPANGASAASRDDPVSAA
jgi:hypothetical protein